MSVKPTVVHSSVCAKTEEQLPTNETDDVQPEVHQWETRRLPANGQLPARNQLAIDLRSAFSICQALLILQKTL